MTLPDERYRAMRDLPKVLLELAKPGCKLRKREVRMLIRIMLRHYPTVYELERIAKRCPELLRDRP